MTEDLKLGNITCKGILDGDIEMEISIREEWLYNGRYEYIDYTQARQLVEHLNEVFCLDMLKGDEG